MQCVRRKSSKGTVQYDERYQKPAIILPPKGCI